MKIIRSPKRLNQALFRARCQGKRIGFVPTMGSLHEGHLSLARRARKENDIVVVSIFVNPDQFGPREDFKRYPRDLKRDEALLKRVRVDYLLVPSSRSIYPKGFREFINPGPRARYLCGPKRPGHFRGVATVVNRLFTIVQPQAAYFGLKDYQQAKVIEDMVQRFALPVRIKTCPIVRESDGLAMSSRNRYLSKKERILARGLYQSLLEARRVIQSGHRSVSRIKRVVRGRLLNDVSKIDYVEMVDPESCAPVKRITKRPVLVAIACFIGTTRLIDNLLVKG
ncbi:MAG: pantoate--beta-alanine ligase [Candidatus Omnitrophica bacterium]|nr:pantoate--beta-alanine ligase [Candidatus Omnitrophota bacterium]